MKNSAEGKFIAYFPRSEHHPEYWKVGSALGTSRVFPQGTYMVPDSAMRTGEKDGQWRLRMLVRDLQALASEPGSLIAAHDARVPVLYDLVNTFKLHLEWAVACVKEGAMTQRMWDVASVVDARMSAMPDVDNASRWTIESLRRSALWGEVRVLAQKALAMMGNSLEPPPPNSM